MPKLRIDIKTLKIPERTILLSTIKKYRHTSLGARDRALASFLYLTGARVSEIVKVTKKEDVKEVEFSGVPFVYVYNVPCLKRQTAVLPRTIPINLEKEESLYGMVRVYMDTLPNDTDVLFPMSRINAYKRIRKIDDAWWNHFLRHCRLTHLTQDGMRIPKLKQFTGWSSMSPADKYIHTQVEDVARDML